MIRGHLLFGKKVCEHFDLPKHLYKWADAPDSGVWLKDGVINKLFHRFTLHGVSNIDRCIEVVRDKGLIEYDDDYEQEIKTLVISHTYLDTFNGFVIPSYPEAVEFKFIKENLPYYFTNCMEDPDGLGDAFDDILSEIDYISSLKAYLTVEYESLPQHHTWMTERILECYD